MKTIIKFKKGKAFVAEAEYPDCFPVIYGQSNGSIHVRNLEGADVATFGANLVEKVEYQP
jgi:hypothetical protein